MAEYRFYQIRMDGHLAGPPVVFDGPTDAAAVKEAIRLLDGHNIEVWQAERVVAHLDHENAHENLAVLDLCAGATAAGNHKTVRPATGAAPQKD